MLKGFKEFIMRGNVVDLAIAVVIGAAFGAVVNAFVQNILTPFIAAIFGEHDFSGLTFTINNSTFRYGVFINALLSFVFIATAIYFFIVVPLNKLAQRRAVRLAKGEEAPEEPKPADVMLLEQIRDLLQAQGGAATTKVE